MDAHWINTITRYQAALRAGDYPQGTVYLRGYHPVSYTHLTLPTSDLV